MATSESGSGKPIIIDLGKKSRKQIKRLKRGEGRLVREVDEAMEEVAAQLGETVEGKELVPVVVLYRQREKKSMRVPMFPIMKS